MKKWLLIATVAFAGAGCSSSEPVNTLTTYMLPNVQTANAAHDVRHQSLLLIRPVEVASHLAGAGLVYQTSPTEIIEAQQNLWGEELGKQLTRRITQDLRKKQTQFWPTQLTPTLSTVNVPGLQIRINQFNGVYTGVAEVAGEWLLINGNGDLQTAHPFSFTVPLAQDGYSAQVEALSKGIDALTTQLARSIKYPH